MIRHSSSLHQARRTVLMHRSVWIVLTLLLSAGCSSSHEKKGTQVEPGPGEILQRMLSAYQEAESYSDQGTLTLSYTQRGTPQKDTVNMSLQVERPGKFRAHAYQLEIASDGEHLRALIHDGETRQLGKQILVRPLKTKTLLPEVLSDTVVSDVLLGGRAGLPVPLELMLGTEPLADFLKPEYAKLLLDDGTVDGRACYQLQITSQELDFRFWIDKKSFILRKIEYPVSRFASELVQSPEAKGVELIAEFKGAKFGIQIPASDLTLEKPDGFQEVLFFVVPPEQIPSTLIGKEVGDFFLTDTSGNQVTSESLKGKINALIWFHDDQACRSYMEQIDQVAERFADDPEIELFGVFTKPPRFTNTMLIDLIKSWDLKLPVVRDLEAFGRDLFHVPVAPTLIVLDKQNKVHIFEPKANLKIADQLPTVLRDLRDGKNIAAEVLVYYRTLWNEYERNLLAATGKARPGQDDSELVTATDPQYMTLTEAWKTPFKNVGNVLAVGGSTPRLLAIEEGRRIVELNWQGERVAQYPLQLNPGETISQIRTVTAKDGTRHYALWRFGGPRVLVYDEQWKLTFSYPPSDQPHGGINDVQLADAEEDGKPEVYVGFWELAGLHRLTIDGTREWRSRGFPNIYSVALSPPNVVGWKKILTSGEKGTILRLNQFGAADPEIAVPGRAIHHLIGSNFPADSGAVYCGISLTAQGLAVGLNQELQEIWAARLPGGVFATDVQFAQPTQLLDGPGQWLLAGPDGTLTLIPADGNRPDRLAFGKHLRGFTTHRGEEKRWLVVSHPDHVIAYQVETKSP